jgi:hypothetical protein
MVSCVCGNRELLAFKRPAKDCAGRCVRSEHWGPELALVPMHFWEDVPS